jgi:hypothetical protein
LVGTYESKEVRKSPEEPVNEEKNLTQRRQGAKKEEGGKRKKMKELWKEYFPFLHF